MSQQNVEIAQRAYDWLASVNNDADHAAAFVADFCDPDAEIVPPAIYPDAERSYRGVEGWLRWQGLLNEIWDDFRFEAERFYDAGDQVVVYARISGTGKQSRAALTISSGHVLTLRDGRIARFEIFLDRPEALRAVGLAE
jgi:ketosteroid isomerase-like protein